MYEAVSFWTRTCRIPPIISRGEAIVFVLCAHRLRCLATLLLSFLAVLAFPGPPKLGAREIRAENHYCQEINDPESGKDLVLEPGEYTGPCKILRGGEVGDPLVIRALDASNPPRIHYDGSHGNVVEIYAGNITIKGLEFGPTKREVDGIRIFSGHSIIIEDCKFSDMGGIAVVANHLNARKLTVRQNEVVNSRSTAMYFGCHDASCIMSDLLIEKNFISGVSAPDPQIGYGIQIKLNSSGIVRDNVVIDLKGPGIMVYGATDSNAISIVERNFVSGSRASAGIVVGGGPARVWNNIVVSNHEGGISLEDYANRGLLKGIVVAHNTAYNNKDGGILVRAEGSVEATLAYNAIASPKQVSNISARQTGIRMFENGDCSSVNCFVNPEQNNFTPLDNLPLLRTKKHDNLKSRPGDDYFGRRRSAHPAIGAIEPPGGVIRMESKH